MMMSGMGFNEKVQTTIYVKSGSVWDLFLSIKTFAECTSK